MSPRVRETLKLFFDIPQATIDLDLNRMNADFDSFFQDEKGFLALSAAEKTPVRTGCILS